MTTRRPFPLGAAAAFAVTCLLSSPARARGDSEVCARSAEKAQELRSEGHLLDALTQLRVCVRPSCPAFVRRDCAQWDGEVEASVPTVVVAARSRDGRDLVDVRVTVDGAPFVQTLDGMAKALDPGEHRFRFETIGAPPVEQVIVLREGEKRREVQVTFAWPAEAPQPRSTPTAPPDRALASSNAGPAAARDESGAWPWIFAGIGATAGGLGAVLATTALADYHSLQSGCGHLGACSSSQVNPVRTRLWIADTAIAVGVVSLGIAGWLALRPLPGGAAVQVTGSL